MNKETVDAARKEAEDSYLIYANLKATYQEAEQDWLKKSRRFRDFDYQLALVDGRLKKIPPASDKVRKEKKQPELTLEQLKSIAATLGVNITIEEPEEISEEVRELEEEVL